MRSIKRSVRSTLFREFPLLSPNLLIAVVEFNAKLIKEIVEDDSDSDSEGRTEEEQHELMHGVMLKSRIEFCNSPDKLATLNRVVQETIAETKKEQAVPPLRRSPRLLAAKREREEAKSENEGEDEGASASPPLRRRRT